MSASVDSSRGRDILYHTDGWTAAAGQDGGEKPISHQKKRTSACECVFNTCS